jgi:7-cyano-7-deazaguanine synthase
MSEQKVVIILSGGMDSAVLLADMLATGVQVHCLTFDYGSKHGQREQQAAIDLTGYYDVPHTIFRLDLKNLLKSNLLQTGGEIPDGHYAEQSMKQTVVPFRNGIMLAIAVGFAESIGFEGVAIGAHTGDHFIYPDCRKGFLQAINCAAIEGTDQGIYIIHSFDAMSKGDIARLGASLRVPFEKTWTCYKGQEVHCGTCGSCTERKEAFAQAGVPDPTFYLN